MKQEVNSEKGGQIAEGEKKRKWKEERNKIM
jgi:hypothetical protein